jgi:hypothetical protein
MCLNETMPKSVQQNICVDHFLIKKSEAIPIIDLKQGDALSPLPPPQTSPQNVPLRGSRKTKWE